MATKVSTQYTPSLNMSVTKRDGRIVKVTTWTTGLKGSTERTHTTSAKVEVSWPKKR